MTDLASVRKVAPRLHKMGIVCAATSLALLLSACDSRNLNETFAAIKAIKVDDSSQAVADGKDSPKLRGNDLKLVYSTAKDLAVGQDGLLSLKDKPHKLAIDVVDPLKMPPPEDGGPMRVLPDDIAAVARLQQAARELPDIPVQTGTTQAAFEEDVPMRMPASAVKPAPKFAAPVSGASGRLIQVGSFSSIDAARRAWDDLQVRYPMAQRYKARFQPVTTADGRALVRLQMGPVADKQAASVCQALAIRDSWCVKATG